MEMKRRDLAKGALWSAPVLVASTQVPLYAASQQVCANLTYGSSLPASTGSVVAGLSPVSIMDGNTQVGTVSTQLTSSTVWAHMGGGRWIRQDGSRENNVVVVQERLLSSQANMGIVTSDTHYPDLIGSLLLNMAAGNGQGQNLTFKFDQPRSKVTFRVYDSDAWSNARKTLGYMDYVRVTSSGNRVTITPNTLQRSISTLSNNTIMPTDMDSNTTSDTNAKWFDVVVEGNVSSINLSYTNGRRNVGPGVNQGILISPIEVC